MTPSNSDPNGRSADGMSGDTGNGTTKQKVKQDAHDAKEEVGARAREKAEAGQHRVADETDTLSDAIDAAASSLDDHDREGLARYARQLSSNLANAAGQLEGRSVDQLASDAKRLARNNPALFMLGSIGVGFGLSRFFKSSAKRDHDTDDKTDQAGAQQNGALENDDSFQDHHVSSGMPTHRRERAMMDTDKTSTSPTNGDGRDML